MERYKVSIGRGNTRLIQDREVDRIMIDYDKAEKERLEREAINKEFTQGNNNAWSDDILPEGERPKYELPKVKAYIEAMNEAQRRTDKILGEHHVWGITTQDITKELFADIWESYKDE